MSKEKMNDPAVKQALRTLKAKGITIKQIEEVYRYYDYLQNKKLKNDLFAMDVK
jgi:biotin operon repressor